MAGRILSAPPRTCACERCRTLVQPGDLMCRAHWLSLPSALRKSILFSRQQRWEGDYAQYVAEALDLIVEREGTYTEISFGKVSETQPCPAGGGSRPQSPSPAMVSIPFLGVAV
jgi:hypothetical protein